MMREFILNPGGGEDRITLYVGLVPDRKQPVLAVVRGTVLHTVARFVDDDAAGEVADLLARMLTTVAVHNVDRLAAFEREARDR